MKWYTSHCDFYFPNKDPEYQFTCVLATCVSPVNKCLFQLALLLIFFKTKMQGPASCNRASVLNILLSLSRDVTLLTLLAVRFCSTSSLSKFQPHHSFPQSAGLLRAFSKSSGTIQSDRQIHCWAKVPNVTLQETGTRKKSSCHHCQLVLHPGDWELFFWLSIGN